MLTVYGIKNCDTMKKTFAWLEANEVAYTFHDYKKLGISQEKLESWSLAIGWEALINRKGITWRKLDPSTQASLTPLLALELMQQQTSLIKRPVIEHGSHVLAGYAPAAWHEWMFTTGA